MSTTPRCRQQAGSCFLFRLDILYLPFLTVYLPLDSFCSVCSLFLPTQSKPPSPPAHSSSLHYTDTLCSESTFFLSSSSPQAVQARQSSQIPSVDSEADRGGGLSYSGLEGRGAKAEHQHIALADQWGGRCCWLMRVGSRGGAEAEGEEERGESEVDKRRTKAGGGDRREGVSRFGRAWRQVMFWGGISISIRHWGWSGQLTVEEGGTVRGLSAEYTP